MENFLELFKDKVDYKNSKTLEERAEKIDKNQYYYNDEKSSMESIKKWFLYSTGTIF